MENSVRLVIARERPGCRYGRFGPILALTNFPRFPDDTAPRTVDPFTTTTWLDRGESFMYRFAIVFAGLGLFTQQVELPKDVHVLPKKTFQVPIHIEADKRENLELVKIYVSEDRGKTWKLQKEGKSTAKKLMITVLDDGLYWFALQTMTKDGQFEPADPDDFEPSLKVFVNTTGRDLKVQKSYGDLLRETEELQRKLEQLQKKIDEIESNQKKK
jgi:hypothetical protein